jgi:hypothetical protein
MAINDILDAILLNRWGRCAVFSLFSVAVSDPLLILRYRETSEDRVP